MTKKIYQLLSLLLIGAAATESCAQEVNKFTGNLSYSENLLTIPSNTGKSIPLTIGYAAGIGLQQDASDVGLGWGLAAGGAIVRNVSGVPDDCYMCYYYSMKDKAPTTQYGCMYFKNGSITQGPSAANVDIYPSRYMNDSLEYYAVDYDNYSISGPGIGGSLIPNLFDYGKIKASQEYGGYDVSGFSKTMQFSMAGDFHDTLISRHYPSVINGSTPVKLQGEAITDYYSSDTRPFMGAEYNGAGTVIGDENFNQSTNRLVTPYYVEYFTNSEINTGVSGFINFESGHARNSSRYTGLENTIGGYRITDPLGMVYHYSLPVYVNKTTNYILPLDNDYKLREREVLDDFNPGIGGLGYSNFIINISYIDGNRFVEYRDENKFAYQWLLTAVTGPDYIDSNTDGMANSGDAGYWVSYDYKLWSEHYLKRTPAFGFNMELQNDPNYDAGYAEPFTPAEEDDDVTLTNDAKVGTISVSDMEHFYLNAISTSSHTALLVREPRKDEFSSVSDFDATLRMNSGSGADQNNILAQSYTGTFTYDNQFYGSGTSWDMTIDPVTAETLSVVITGVNAGTLYVYENNSSGTLLATINSSTSFPCTTAVNTGKAFLRHVSTAKSQGFVCNWTSTVKKKPFPLLAISKLILMKNSDMASLPAKSSFSTPTGFSLSNTTNSSNYLYTGDWYTANKTAIDNLSLQTVEFTYDYSLCKYYHRNINITAPDTLGFRNWNEVPSSLGMTGGQTAVSGKLTLTEINTFGLSHSKIAPGFLFDYNYASSTDNPDYDARAADYWGYYKSDFAAPALSRYTTSTSKDYTDAWSLRKITLPSGGLLEFDYESNSYEKVWNETGGYRGAARIYPIAMATYYKDHMSERAGKKWKLRMESPSVSDFTSLVSSAPGGTSKSVFISRYEYTTAFQDYICSGTFNIYTSPLRITGVQKVYYSLRREDKFSLDTDSTKFISYDNDSDSYKGNGYLKYELPMTTTNYGGGIRVKKITSRNGTAEGYVQEYVYENGVATMEADRFLYPKAYRDWNGGDKMYRELTSFSVDKNQMGPAIGYGKISERNLGRINAAQGEVVCIYNTANNELGADQLNVQKRSTSYGTSYCHYTGSVNDTCYIIELNRKGLAWWGVLTEERMTDVNGTILSKSTYEYDNTLQGATVQVLDAQNVNGWDFCKKRIKPNGDIVNANVNCPSCNRYNHTITIIRDYQLEPIAHFTYAIGGASSLSDVLKRDEITGQAVESYTEAANKSTRKEKVVPAFRVTEYVTCGPKALNSAYTNQTSLGASTKIVVDTTITGGGDFAQRTAATFSKSFNMRYYDLAGGYTTGSNNYGFWLNQRSYVWGGQAGSINTYGLYKGSEVTAHPFSYSNPDTCDLRWRFSGEANLMDSKTHVLENIGFKNTYAASKFDIEENQPIASVSNCNYLSFTYTGFEETKSYTSGMTTSTFFNGEVLSNSNTTQQTSGARTAHTGTKYISVSSGNDGPIYKVKHLGTGSKGEELGLLRGRTYRASVWIHSDSPANAKLIMSLTGTSNSTTLSTTVQVQKNDAKAIQVGDWYLVWVDINVPADYTSAGTSPNDLRIYVNAGSGAAYFDDLQFHPVVSNFSAKVYDPKTGWLISDLGNDTYATKYIYDNAGRVTEIWQEVPGIGLKKIKSTRVNFARGLN
jgi:hypothetical protein